MESAHTIQVQRSPPFELSDEAVEAAREMFLFKKKLGQDITRMHLTFTETDQRARKMASGDEHA